MTAKDFAPWVFQPHGVITLSNTGGIEVMLNRSNDGVYYRFNYGQDLENEEIFEAKLESISDEDTEETNFGFYHKTSHNEPIFYSLSDCIRVKR